MIRPLDVGRRRKWFRGRRVAAAAGGTYDEVVYDPLLEAQFLQLTTVAVEDETNAPSGHIRVYVRGHGYEHWILDEASPSADTLYWARWPTYLVEGEQLVARFYGATASDRLVLYFEGWIHDYPMPVTTVEEAVTAVVD